MLVGNLAALFERHVHGGELFLHPADAHAKNEAAGGELIDGGGDPGPMQGVAIGHHHDAHAELDFLGATGEKSQTSKGIEEGPIGRHDKSRLLLYG